ncbi:RNA polymerase sigma factor [Paenibacillus sp. FJAT-27812]|uniref:RNA polymerase sigma factor n=1 Tax=Paenibacillus sp. FJAT-27812 TaxID=1684143 RepID=UPI0006A7CAD7|nr:hypothetical protein [Paenibacillus sp. FJAT-27812]
MTANNQLDDSLLPLYSRKIFGFALSKTAHEQNAKDLSQEILLVLYRSLLTGKQVDNMDAWVHTICCYTWSNGLAFQGSHLNDNFLLWSLLTYAVWKQYYKVKDQAYYDQYQPDERKDGGKYIVNASIVYSEEEYKTNLPDYEIVRKYATNGIKTRSSEYCGGISLNRGGSY